ncbi:MAG TPA: ribonuclease III domain-containing protein [Bacilli bacterium]|nr:ribonuclease III domain-containing protein [Bacilli bacterium]
MNNISRNILALAYLGDAVYEVYIRKYLLDKGIEKVNTLQAEAKNYVSAKSQCKYLNIMIDNNFFTEDELNIVYRARNHKGTRHPKNTDIVTYKYSTGFEALIGYLYLENNIDRILEIIKEIIGE